MMSEEDIGKMSYPELIELIKRLVDEIEVRMMQMQ